MGSPYTSHQSMLRDAFPVQCTANKKYPANSGEPLNSSKPIIPTSRPPHVMPILHLKHPVSVSDPFSTTSPWILIHSRLAISLNRPFAEWLNTSHQPAGASLFHYGNHLLSVLATKTLSRVSSIYTHFGFLYTKALKSVL